MNAKPVTRTNPQPPNFNPGESLDLKQIKQIIELMKRSELSEFALEEEGFKIKIRRGQNGHSVVSNGHAPSPHFTSADAPPSGAGPAPSAPPSPGPAHGREEEVGVTFIKSPMVGTFYRSASPESKPFADIGTKVVENSLVCIIEAMKIMNEIQAEAKGVILEVLVENGQPVEYGQRLFKVKQG